MGGNNGGNLGLGVPLCPLNFFGVGLEQWIPLTPLEQMAENEYDVLIVGSGAGGGASLWRLCEQWGNNGKKIGLIKAGDLLLPTHPFNLPTLDFFTARQMVESYYVLTPIYFSARSFFSPMPWIEDPLILPSIPER